MCPQSGAPAFAIAQNRLLAAITGEERNRLAPQLQPIELELSHELFAPGDQIDFAYFPLNCVISVISEMVDGRCVEVGMCGNEGMVGFSIVLDDSQSHHRGIVQAAGLALRISAAALKDELRQGGALRSVLLRHVHFALIQASQSAACNRLHLLEQRCARWLLCTRDRVKADTFFDNPRIPVLMLGVRRAGVTVALNELERSGLIRHCRRWLTVLDTKGLEARSCECYGVLKDELTRLLGPTDEG